MRKVSTPGHRRRGLDTVHVKWWIHKDAYALVEAECPLDARGRRLGIVRVIERCIFIVLGGKAVKRTQQEQ